MQTYIAASLVAMLYVSLRAIQQRHVQHEQYLRMPIVSMLMAYCDMFLVSSAFVVARDSMDFWNLFWLATCIGVGGSLGSILGTWLHARKNS